MSLHFTSPPIYNRAGFGDDGVFVPDVKIDNLILWGSSDSILENLNYLSNEAGKKLSFSLDLNSDSSYIPKSSENILVKNDLSLLNVFFWEQQNIQYLVKLELYSFEKKERASTNVLGDSIAYSNVSRNDLNVIHSLDFSYNKSVTKAFAKKEAYINYFLGQLNKIDFQINPITDLEEVSQYEIIKANFTLNIEYSNFKNEAFAGILLNQIILNNTFYLSYYKVNTVANYVLPNWQKIKTNLDLFSNLIERKIDEAKFQPALALDEILFNFEESSFGLENKTENILGINKPIIYNLETNISYLIDKKEFVGSSRQLILSNLKFVKEIGSFYNSLYLTSGNVKPQVSFNSIKDIYVTYSKFNPLVLNNLNLFNSFYADFKKIYSENILTSPEIRNTLNTQVSKTNESNVLNILEKNKLKNKFAKSEYKLNSLTYSELKSKSSIQSILNSFSSKSLNHSIFFSKNLSALDKVFYRFNKDIAGYINTSFFGDEVSYEESDNSKEYGKNRIDFPSDFEYPKILYSAREPNYELPDNSPTTGLMVYEGVENNNLYFYKPDENYMNWKYFGYDSRDGIFDPCEFPETADRTLDPLQVSSLSNRGDNPFWYLPGLLTVDSELHTADGAPCLYISQEIDRNFSIDLENGSGPLLPENNHEVGDLVIFTK